MMGRMLLWFLIGFCLLGNLAPVSAQQNSGTAPVPPAASPQVPGGGQGEDTLPADIHDIKPPEPAGFDPTLLCYGLLAVLVIGLLILAFYLWKNRKRRLKHKVAPVFPPETVALNALDELNDVEQADGKVFYFRLSAVLRHYIQGRYGINAPEMTTEELLPRMDQLGTDRTLIPPLKSLFYTADPIKFAGIHAVVSQMENDLSFARKFVKETTPAEVPAGD